MYFVLGSVGAGVVVALVLLFFLAGMLLGASIMSMRLKKQLKENPPISEAQIREMYRQMGKKPSESQIRRAMNSIKAQR